VLRSYILDAEAGAISAGEDVRLCRASRDVRYRIAIET
jgi:hypothetical protein